MNIRNIFKHVARPRSFLLSLVLLISACGGNLNTAAIQNSMVQNTTEVNNVSTSEYQVVVSGGYETDPRDNGRPVVLIASMLGVSPEVFREAFSHVQPAGAGMTPSTEHARMNKELLMSVLAPYGITNDYLDTVSNYYRYNGSAGETWRHTPAVIKAVVTDGVVTGFEIVNPGSGYTSAPSHHGQRQ